MFGVPQRTGGHGDAMRRHHGRMIDFGLAHSIDEFPMTDSCGTLYYAAPEVLRGANVRLVEGEVESMVMRCYP